MLVLGAIFFNAKSNPQFSSGTALAFERANSLNNGVSISWLERTWDTGILKNEYVKEADFKLLSRLGFKSIRLPVAFDYFESKAIPPQTVFAKIDNVIKLCKTYGFKLILDYHDGNLNDNNYLTETPRLIKLWVNIATRYKNERPDFLFFELYNEPPHMNPQIWKDAAYNIDVAIRKIDQQRTLIVGASNFNSIYELSRFVRLADDNVIYTFHFYEPFFFTHQGADWIGDQVSTTGVPFPYTVENFPALNPRAKGTWGETNYGQYKTDGNEQSINDKLKIVKNWSDKYYVPVICGEYGVYNKYADLGSRCRYIKAMRAALKKLHIPGLLWDYNSNFSIFDGTPSIDHLPPCMRDAIGYGTQN
jgi:endoglucanase